MKRAFVATGATADIGTKRTCQPIRAMSVIAGKPEVTRTSRKVRFWPKVAVPLGTKNVRLRGTLRLGGPSVSLDSILGQSEYVHWKARRFVWHHRVRVPRRLLSQTFGRKHSGEFANGTPGTAFAGRIS